jgi:HEAT repeat protein
MLFTIIICLLNIVNSFSSDDAKSIISNLKDNNPKIRRETADQLGDIRNKETVKHLIPLLKDDNEYVRQAAARALGKLRDKEAVEPLIESLKDDDEYVRAFSIWALGEIRDPRAVEHVVNSLMDKEEKVVVRSYEALRKFKAYPDTKAELEKIFIKSFEGNNYSQTQKISYVLDKDDILKALEDPEGDNSKTIINYLKLLESNISELKETGVKGLKEYKDRALVIGKLSAIIITDEKSHDAAVLFLKGLNDIGCLPLFTYILENKKSFSYSAKMFAVDAISDLGHKETTDLLLEILLDTGEYEGLRDHAARALGKLGDKKAVDQLINILKNKTEDKNVRVGSAVALGSIKDKKAVEPLINIFKNDKEDIWLRVATVSALGDIGDVRAIKPLEEKIDDPTGYLKHAVEIALRKFNRATK